MGILEFVHAQDPAENRELFGLLGEYATSPLVREKLGGVINSEPGRLWFILTTDDATRVMAFGSLRFGRTAVHLLHLHALEEEADIPVLERCIEFVRKAGATRLVTTDYWTRRDLYLRYGFCSIRKIGRFMRFEREFKYEY